MVPVFFAGKDLKFISQLGKPTKSVFKIDGNKLVNEQRDRKTGVLQITISRETVDGKMVEVIKYIYYFSLKTR